MNCQQAKYLTEQTLRTHAEEEQLWEHASHCVSCHQYLQLHMLADLTADDELLKVIVPDGLEQRIMVAIETQQQQTRKIPLWIRISSAAAAIASGLLLGSLMYDARAEQSYSSNEINITSSSDTIYVAGTSELMYYPTIFDQGQ